MVRVIAQSPTQFLKGRGDTVIELHHGPAGPECPLEFFPGDHLAGMFQQKSQHSERFVLEPDPLRSLAQFAGPKVEGKAAEPRRTQ